jgi:uncharacterized protein YjiS (DUF1127 family)
MQTIARAAYVATAAAKRPLAVRLIGWLVALDAGYRNAHKLAACTDERLADMGVSRAEARAECARRLGDLDQAPVTAPGW